LIPARGSLVEGNVSEIEIEALPYYFTLFKLSNSIFSLKLQIAQLLKEPGLGALDISVILSLLCTNKHGL